MARSYIYGGNFFDIYYINVEKGSKAPDFGGQTKNSHRTNAMAISFFLWWTIRGSNPGHPD